MKITGYAVVLMGLVIMSFSLIGIIVVQDSPSWINGQSDVDHALKVLFTFGILSTFGGGLILLFGGKGYRETANPTINN